MCNSAQGSDQLSMFCDVDVAAAETDSLHRHCRSTRSHDTSCAVRCIIPATTAKSETNPGVFKSKYLEICDELPGYYQMYTDGCKTNNGTAAAAVSCDAVKSLRLTSHAGIFTAELVALNLALDIIRRSRRKKLLSSLIHYQDLWLFTTAT